MLRVPLLVCLFLFSCCVSPSTVLLKHDPDRYDPPPAYSFWWKEIEACSGFKAVPSTLVFYSVARMPDSKQLGLWWGDHSIWILRGWEFNQRLVKHEMLHELLNLAGEDNGHGHPAFGADQCNLFAKRET